jgi:hypothetical protein
MLHCPCKADADCGSCPRRLFRSRGFPGGRCARPLSRISPRLRCASRRPFRRAIRSRCLSLPAPLAARYVEWSQRPPFTPTQYRGSVSYPWSLQSKHPARTGGSAHPASSDRPPDHIRSITLRPSNQPVGSSGQSSANHVQSVRSSSRISGTGRTRRVPRIRHFSGHSPPYHDRPPGGWLIILDTLDFHPPGAGFLCHRVPR